MRKPVVIPTNYLSFETRRFGRDKNRNDRPIMASLVEVLKIESIAIHLVETRAIELARAEFVLDHENHAQMQNDEVGSSPHSRYEELHEEVCFGKFRRKLAQVLYLIFPGCALSWLQRKWELQCQLPKEIVVGSRMNVARIDRQVGAIHLKTAKKAVPTGRWQEFPSSYPISVGRGERP